MVILLCCKGSKPNWKIEIWVLGILSYATYSFTKLCFFTRHKKNHVWKAFEIKIFLYCCMIIQLLLEKENYNIFLIAINNHHIMKPHSIVFCLSFVNVLEPWGWSANKYFIFFSFNNNINIYLVLWDTH